MRPAFERYLGAEGREMMRQDRDDHARAKAQLVPLLDVSVMGDAEMRFVGGIFVELATHMHEESGVQIPRLESVLDGELSRELARRYQRCMRLQPNSRRRDGEVLFKGGIREYVAMDGALFRKFLVNLGEGAEALNEHDETRELDAVGVKCFREEKL